ncbi:hypothetical protein SETIT_3G385900v2 [Setaria italica]|uniref:Disease resistance protein At4g27190-like leucine-rich repeats domain-containing protein n=1 Tax=Setaria italica TaxID=4555 RepID=K3Z387_SETIT|nr:uncharacterized protein LOC101782670 [Setaria italica]XP_004963142.1 uncharacterized protein LOC101782670 [Setaria italica]XP_004963143.1 uncharacterized protein LOC101782670 [Setaria italica]XP_014660294.1 uncharacterized protein LOC101782670 [Setaria italica]XP_022681347.1 uncharacterized protein LOC101782670 [Setaria italica]XP_022681348.1 uncharacterized protein LOC101782670 [Setaria italica]XP_022681349.1 uncharacterized protein LOC101782670 [Setaria italica]RCV19453.1 hypothetical p
MRVDESIEIEADDIRAAAGDILDFLEDTSKEKEIYFKGWDGFGASAALKAVAKMLQSAESMKNPKLKFDRVIHIDCSLWKSRRALQKAIAEELKLPNPVMAIFDQKDRDDDFKGVDEAARREIDDVTKEIFMNLAGRRFMVIFHNGGNEYIDFFEFGIPIYGHLRSKVLWTFHGRFRPHVQVDDEVKETIEKRTDVFLRAVPTDRSDVHESVALSNAVLEEANEVATYLTTYKHPNMVLECILHMWAHKYVGGMDWGAHASSYWVCDGIIRDGGKNPELLLKERMWEIAGDLHSNIHLNWDLEYVSRAVHSFKWVMPDERWIRILLPPLIPHDTDFQQSSHSFQTIIEKNQEPTMATSFIAPNRDKPSTDEQQGFTTDTTGLSSHMFKHYENLRVIQLSWCTFNFSAPPFLYCKKLKFLRLVHCKDLGTSASSDGGEVKDQTTHGTGSLSCDGIIRDGGKNPELLLKERMWEIAGDLHSNIHLNWDLEYVSRAVPSFKSVMPDGIRILLPPLIPHHTDCQQSSHSFQTIIEKNHDPTMATSFFIAPNRDKPSTDEQQGFTTDTTRLSSHMFKHYKNLRVIQLSWCTFSFSAPPFLYCKKLKFLRLDHCKDLGTSASSDGGEVKDQTTHGTGSLSRPCPDDLLVLHLNHTNINLLWCTGPPMNPRELYFSGVKNWIEHHLHAVQLGELGKLGVTTDQMETFPNLLQAKSLRTITLDGCTELKEVGPDVLPPSLESFTFFVESSTANKGTPSKGVGEGGAKVHTISLRCCTQLKGLFLRGWFKKLKMLDLSGTLLKTLDLSMVEAPFLCGFRLLGCHMLCAILWPPARPRLQELQIDTTTTQLSPSCCLGGTHFNISVRDGRLLGSLVPIGDHFLGEGLHIDISSPDHAASYASSINDDDDSIIIATSGCSISKKQMLLGWRPGQPYTKDVSFDCTTSSGSTTLLAPLLTIHRDDNASATAWMWDCPRAPYRGAYIRVEDRMQKTGLVLGPGQGTELLCDHATILHVHDSASITGIPFPAILSWAKLLWCRVERCQRLDTVFCTPEGEGVGGGSRQAMFWYIQTLWVSQLPVARHVWSWSVAAQPDERSFEDLRYVHLHNCPRLLHVLPLSMSVNLGRLHTLEIVCCDSLTEVFPVPAKREVVNFWRLRRLHLHELPALLCLSGRRMLTPELETVRVRGCWSLRRMPAVGDGTGVGSKRKPTVDCEEEWWDRLVWDGVRLGHDPSLYRTLHPRYGRETGLRPGTLLR